ncbi:hypothetical protein SCUP234_12846 [Seiridium cupressi]
MLSTVQTESLPFQGWLAEAGEPHRGPKPPHATSNNPVLMTVLLVPLPDRSERRIREDSQDSAHTDREEFQDQVQSERSSDAQAALRPASRARWLILGGWYNALHFYDMTGLSIVQDLTWHTRRAPTWAVTMLRADLERTPAALGASWAQEVRKLARAGWLRLM